MRDLLEADEVIDAILHLARARFVGIVNIGSGQGRSILSIAQAVIHASGKQVFLKPVPAPAPTALVADVTRLRSILSSAKSH